MSQWDLYSSSSEAMIEKSSRYAKVFALLREQKERNNGSYYPDWKKIMTITILMGKNIGYYYPDKN